MDKDKIDNFSRLVIKYKKCEKISDQYQIENELSVNITCVLESEDRRDTLYLDGFPEYFTDTSAYTMLLQNKQYYCNDLCHFIDNIIKENDEHYNELRINYDIIKIRLRKYGSFSGDLINLSEWATPSSEYNHNLIESKRNKKTVHRTTIKSDTLKKVIVLFDQEESYGYTDCYGVSAEEFLKGNKRRIEISEPAVLSCFHRWKSIVEAALTEEYSEFCSQWLRVILYEYKHHSDTLCIYNEPCETEYNHIRSKDTTFFYMINSFLYENDSIWRNNQLRPNYPWTLYKVPKLNDRASKK